MAEDEPDPMLRPRPRVARGNRPWFLDHPDTERVLSIVLAVASEMSVLYERVDTLERVASEKGYFTLDDLESYTPPPEAEKARAEWREAFLDRMFRILLEETGALEAKARETAYKEFVQSLNEDSG